jgi:hypothetical protein
LDACLPEEVADRLEHVAITKLGDLADINGPRSPLVIHPASTTAAVVESLRSPPDLELAKQGDWLTPNVRPASAR